MARKIFRSIFYTSVLIMLLCLIMILGTTYKYYYGQYESSIENEARFISSSVEAGGKDCFKNLSVSHRITWIDTDGSVIYDSTSEDTSSLDNHSGRDEVIKAMECGQGRSIRYSSTMARKTINVAIRLEDGTVLRVSDTQYSLLMLIYSMLGPIYGIIIASVLISLIIALRLAGSFIKPINEIDLDSPQEDTVYKELKPLVRRIKSQNRQIKQQIIRIQQEHEKNDRLRREFTANVSHELKTPLTSISGFAEIIRDGIAKPQDIPRFADKIYNEAHRLMTLVIDIINISQLEDVDMSTAMEDIDLLKVCRNVIETIRPLAQMKNVILELEGQETHIKGSEKIVEEMIYNLCDNSVKYNKPGGSVKVYILNRDDGIVVNVSDTGIGIPEKDLNRVFERFYRVDKSHSREMGGTGLGLSIVKHGAACHNAKIVIHSKLGEGTTIAVVFPSIKRLM